MKFGSRPARLAVLVCCFAVALAGGVAAVGAVTTADGSAVSDADLVADSLVAQQDGIETDRIRIDIDLKADGSATWTIEFWSVLDDDDSVAAFDSLADDIDDDPDSYTADFADRIDGTVATANQSTNREMAAGEFSIETDRQSLGREYGIIRYSFEWAGFAAVDGEALQAGDAIDGLFLDDGSRLLISWPEAYELQSVTPEPDDERASAVLWRGDSSEFLTGEPRLAVSQPTLGVGTGTLAVSLAALAVVFGVTGWLLRRRSSITPRDVDSAAVSGSAPESTDPETDTEIEEADEAAAPTVDQSVDSTQDADVHPDPELLSNEEQVLQLLEANGGRMKQQTVVSELGWTDAKTSKVVSKLRDADEIESFRIGRENVLRVLDEDTEGSSL